jgi:hypothetical protein
MNYLSYEKKDRKEFIKRFYAKVKDRIPEEFWDVPLREFTYERKRNFVDKEGRFFFPEENLVILLDQYIHLYKVKLPVDVSLKDAINLI